MTATRGMLPTPIDWSWMRTSAERHPAGEGGDRDPPGEQGHLAGVAGDGLGRPPDPGEQSDDGAAGQGLHGAFFRGGRAARHTNAHSTTPCAHLPGPGCCRIAPAAMPTERRKNPRLGLAIPLRVQGFLADGTTWEEITTTVDVSTGRGLLSPEPRGRARPGPAARRSPCPSGCASTTSTTRATASTRSCAGCAGGPTSRGSGSCSSASTRPAASRSGRRRATCSPRTRSSTLPRRRACARARRRSPGPRRRPPPKPAPTSTRPLARHARRRARPARRPEVGLPSGGGSHRPLSAPLPDDSGAGYTPPAFTAPSTIPKGRAGVPPAPVPGAPTPEFQPSHEVPQRPPRRPARGALRELHDPAGGRVGRGAAGGADRGRQRLRGAARGS